jgi:hypothetical protein
LFFSDQVKLVRVCTAPSFPLSIAGLITPAIRDHFCAILRSASVKAREWSTAALRLLDTHAGANEQWLDTRRVPITHLAGVNKAVKGKHV